jgi:hypothetical protein
MKDIVIKDRDGNPYPTDFASVRAAVLEQVGLVGVTEIAERAGVQPNTVKVWRSRHVDFPPAALQLAAGPLWFWPDVEPWVTRQLAKKPGPQRS